MAQATVKRMILFVIVAFILFEGVNSQNKFAPKFDYFPTSVNVPETATFGDIIWSCNATDGDNSSTPAGQLKFQMNTQGFVPRWVLDSGYCVMYVNTKLDYESQLTHTLRVVVRDLDLSSPRSTTGTFTINVIDVNDNTPECEEYHRVLYVPEDKVVGTVITKAVCTDPDRNKTHHGKVLYKISDSNSGEVNNTFDINYDGSVTLKKLLDYERVKSYVLTMDVYDNAGAASLTTSITYDIQVKDIDDNKPTWPTNPLTVYVKESTVLGTVAFTLTANDADKPLTAATTIRYGIKTPAVPDWFGIDSVTGAVYVKGILNRHISPCVTMEVFAYSSNKNKDISVLMVDIKLTDDNTKTTQQNCDVPKDVTTTEAAADPESSTNTYSKEPNSSEKPTVSVTSTVKTTVSVKSTEKPTVKTTVSVKSTEKPTVKTTVKSTVSVTSTVKPTVSVKSTEKTTVSVKSTEKTTVTPTAKTTEKQTVSVKFTEKPIVSGISTGNPTVSKKTTQKAIEKTTVSEQPITSKEPIYGDEDVDDNYEFVKGLGAGIGSTLALVIIIILTLAFIYQHRNKRVYKI